MPDSSTPVPALVRIEMPARGNPVRVSAARFAQEAPAAAISRGGRFDSEALSAVRKSIQVLREEIRRGVRHQIAHGIVVFGVEAVAVALAGGVKHLGMQLLRDGF